MDFDQLDTSAAAEAGFELQLEHPKTGEQLEAWITIRGVDSAAYKKAALEQNRRRIKAMSRKREASITPEQIEEESLDLLVAATAAFRGIEVGGKPLECTPETARAHYKRFPWVREQVSRALGDYGNFLPASAKN